MPTITITLNVPDAQAELFEGCDFMVTPLSDKDAEWLAAALHLLEETTLLNRKVHATLRELLETKTATSAQIAETLNQLAEPNRAAVEQIKMVRTYLGRSARVGQKKDKEQMQ